MSSPVEKYEKTMEARENQTRALENYLIEEAERLEDIFFQNHQYTASQLAGTISFLEEALTVTTPALLRASKLHEIIQRILDIRNDDSKRTSTRAKHKDSSSKQPRARHRVRHQVPAQANPHHGAIPKAHMQSTQQTRIFLFHFRARFAALLKEYQKIMEHDVPELTSKPEDPVPVPVALSEAISDAIAAGRVKIIVSGTGTGEKEDLSESEARCRCSRHSTDIAAELHYTPEYTRRVVKDREIREEFFAKTPGCLKVGGGGEVVEASDDWASEKNNENDAKLDSNSEDPVHDISVSSNVESLVVKHMGQSSELSLDQLDQQEDKGTKDNLMGKNIAGDDQEKLDFVILGGTTLASDIDPEDEWVCVGDDGF